MKNSVKERNYSLDILRILCCVAILIYHLPMKNEALKSITYIFASPALALFFMLTGFFGEAPNPSKAGIYPYYKKKFVHIGLPLFIFTVFYGYVHFLDLKTVFSIEGMKCIFAGARQSVLGIVAGPNMQQLWFLYDVLAIYIIWPFVKAGLDALEEKGQRKLLYLIVILQIVITLFYLKSGSVPYFSSVIYLTGWIIYPILGYMARNSWVEKYDRFLYIAGPLCLIINIYMAISEKWIGNNPDVYTFSVLFIVQSLFLFRIFLKLKVKGGVVLEFLSKRTFTVYLLGAYTTVKFYQYVTDDFFSMTLAGMAVTIIILTIVTFAIASLIDVIILENLEKLCFFVLEKIENVFKMLQNKVKKRRNIT